MIRINRTPGPANSLVIISLAIVLVAMVPGLATGQNTNDVEQPIQVSNRWPQDVTVTSPAPIHVIIPAYPKLWLEAAQHSEVELQLEVLAMLQEIHHRGVDQTAAAGEIRNLIRDGNHQSLNLAIASLLISLEARDSARDLFDMLEPGRVEISQVVEPALALWKYEPAVEVWKQRLSDPLARRTLLFLAIDCLGVSEDPSASEQLISRVMDQDEKASIRLAAARAVGRIGPQDLVEQAKALVANDSGEGKINRLCGVALLAKQDSDSATALLQELLLDEEAAVAGAAWHRVLEIDSGLAGPNCEKCIHHNDPNVRKCVVTAMFEHPTIARIDLLGELLNDRHPHVRLEARVALRRLAGQSNRFDQRVRSAGMNAVNGPLTEYRCIEQALILLGSLDHERAAERALELLADDRPNIYVTAAWTLRMLQVESTYDEMLVHATRVSEDLLRQSRLEDPNILPERLDQIAHLFDSFGESAFQPADPLLRRFVPKNLELGNNCRPAAITALGKLHRGDSDSELIPDLVRRMNDQFSDSADLPEVWSTSAIALGRMKARTALGDLRRYFDGGPPVSGINYAAAWAIRELTGEEIPAPVAPVIKHTGFGLEPVGPRLGTDGN